MRLEEIEEGERLLAEAQRDDHGSWMKAASVYNQWSEWAFYNAPALIAAAKAAAWRPTFQQRVDGWMDACFTPQIKADMIERADRFTEEALELVQTVPGFTADRAHALVDYVFSRDTGERHQEVGGVMVTLAALCNPGGVDMEGAAETELARISKPETIEKIRAKQAAKPTGSALPIGPLPGEG